MSNWLAVPEVCGNRYLLIGAAVTGEVDSTAAISRLKAASCVERR
jgi:hypothetical protein